MSVILDYLPKGKGKIHHCVICGQEFRGRARAKLCGKRSCINENHRRHGMAQWQKKRGANFNRRSPSQRFKHCPCGAVIENTCGNKTYCDRCRTARTKRTLEEKAARRKAAGMVDPKGSASCPSCGGVLQFRYDFLGRSLEQCLKCGERPVQIYGKRIYDQRTRLEAELRARQDRVEAPIDEGASERSRGRTQFCKVLKWGKGVAGNAFRQWTHKRGAA